VPAGSKAKEPEPRFNAKKTESERFTNGSVKGKVVLLEFWTTWCGYCFKEAGLVHQIIREFRDKGLTVLAVDGAESKKRVNRYPDQHPRTSRIVLTDDTNLGAMYQATVYRIYAVIDRDGNIAGRSEEPQGRKHCENIWRPAGMDRKRNRIRNSATAQLTSPMMLVALVARVFRCGDFLFHWQVNPRLA
jgi:thiol-disulfide isomerase/thioredoxin